MSTMLYNAPIPRNFPETPARFPLPMFRLQVEAASRYLFESELREALSQASIPLDVLTGVGEPIITVAHTAKFMQTMRVYVGDEKAMLYGREAFQRVSAVLPRASGATSNGRWVSSSDKLFLKVRDAFAVLNKQAGMNFVVKWHGGAEADIFEDTAQHCYGVSAKTPACATMTGLLEEAILYLAGTKMNLVEYECMGMGALACRWHCRLA